MFPRFLIILSGARVRLRGVRLPELLLTTASERLPACAPGGCWRWFSIHAVTLNPSLHFHFSGSPSFNNGENTHTALPSEFGMRF